MPLCPGQLRHWLCHGLSISIETTSDTNEAARLFIGQNVNGQQNLTGLVELFISILSTCMISVDMQAIGFVEWCFRLGINCLILLKNAILYKLLHYYL